MLKSLIVILIVVLLVAIGLNFDDLFSNNHQPIKKMPVVEVPVEVITPSIEELSPIKIETVKIESNRSIIISKPSESNLTQEVQALIKKANQLFQNSKDDEAMALYYEVIKKTEKSQDPILLKQFVEAYLQIAFLYQIYPNSDQDASIEAYDMIINRFKESNNTELLGAYIHAKIQQAYLLTNEERLDTYDELIKKFEHHKSRALQEKVEELLISKSFDLMGKDDEEAMQILDTLIDKYKNQKDTPLPEQIEMAILNNLELAIITNNDDDKYRDLAKEYLSESSDTKPLLDMLNIIKNAQDLNQDEALAQWKKDYKTYRFKDWSFQELRRWIQKMEDKETQQRVTRYIDVFENHKYNINPTTKLPYKEDFDGVKETIVLEAKKYIMTPEESTQYEEQQAIKNEEIKEYENPYSNPDEEFPTEEEVLF